MTLSEAAILVVDDEPALREIFAQWLTIAGCPNITTAPDGEEALTMLRAKHYDLLITDVRMPRMDGITLVRELAKNGSSIPSIIFVSGFGDVDEREMYDLGAEAFMAKPLHRAELLAIMERALAARSSLWLSPMDPPPRQSIFIEVDGVANGTPLAANGTPRAGNGTPLAGNGTPHATADAAEQGLLLLGHGGFSAPYPGPLVPGKIAFQCNFPASQKRELSGEGIVRWYSKTDKTVGIEFSFIDPSSRTWLLETLAAIHPLSFIPCL